MFNLANLKFLAIHAVDAAGIAFVGDLLNQLADHPISSDNTLVALTLAVATIVGKFAVAWLTKNEPPVAAKRS